MERTELVKSGKYYTYGHYLDGNLIYLGEGKGYRAWHFWDKPYYDQRDQVQVRIFGIFDSKELAVFNEGLLISKERMEGNVHLLNKSECGRGAQGCKRSEETRNKVSNSKIGEHNPMFGKMGKQSANFKGLTIGVNRENKTIVFRGSTDMSSRGFYSGAVSAVILGTRPHHQGFTFIRTDDPQQLRELLNTAIFYDEVSRLRIQEFLDK